MPCASRFPVATREPAAIGSSLGSMPSFPLLSLFQPNVYLFFQEAIVLHRLEIGLCKQCTGISRGRPIPSERERVEIFIPLWFNGLPTGARIWYESSDILLQ
jgi:hypothetical protein